MSRWLKHRLHASWLIAWFSLATIGGLVISLVVKSSYFAAWPTLTVIAMLLLVVFTKRVVGCVLLTLVAGLLLGLWRGSIEQNNLTAYLPLFSKNVVLQGTVSDDTSYGSHGDQRLILKDITITGKRIPGRIWVSADAQTDIKRSDIVSLQGKLGNGFGSLAASVFHAQIISTQRPVPGDIGLRVRDWFAAGIRKAIPEPEASLASGYLVGQRSTLPEDLDNQLKMVGLTHAVVASGYNLTILVGFARQLFLGISKYLATLAAAGMITSFIMISGLSPSMSRAGLVTSLSLAAWYYGRTIHPLVLLPFAAAPTALINPAFVWGDIGWYLSFTSFAGVIIVAPLIRRYFWGNKKRVGALRQVLIDTMSAQIATLPIMIFTFGHYSPYALLANLLILPLIPLTMVLTFGAGLAGLIVPGAAHLLGLPATLILRYMTIVVARIANLPGAQGELAINAIWLGLSYAILGMCVFFVWHKTRYNFRGESAMEPIAESV